MFFIFSSILRAEELGIGSCILYDLQGNEVRLSDFKGKPLIICFWATWCPSCRREIRKLNNLYAELDSSGIKVLAINVGERKAKIDRFLRSYPVGFKVLQDRDGDCAFFYGIVGIPAFLLIDRKGKVRLERYYFPKDEYKQLLLD
jgi:peroxiredoxin